jgi:hypothetical protein
VFSPDGKWIVYDTRNDDTHISRTAAIEKVNIETGEIVRLYTTQNQTVHGPGVGAVAWHPHQGKIIFIHGLLNCDEKNPYGFTRRFGAIVDTDKSLARVHAEARSIEAPLVPGALRGGTHAHTWSGDGTWISFTYNDHLMALQQNATAGAVKDLRTIGVMAPLKKVKVAAETAEEFSGEYFTVVAATVVDQPTPGSDQIDRAFDECWIGNDGYLRKDGSKQKRAIAFQGNVINADGTLITEVFVADIPDDITQATEGLPIQGTLTTRPNVPAGLTQRRITFTAARKHPGLQGPRFRLRTSPDGSVIYFLMKDEADIVQIFSVSSVGGAGEVQLTNFKQSVQAQFNVSPNGKHLSCVAGNIVWTVEIVTGKAVQLTTAETDNNAPVGGALWRHDSKALVYNRYVGDGENRYLQIFKLETP